MAVLLRGTTDMHELLHCYEFTSCSSSSKCLACACSASQQRGNAERMLHQCCGQDYLKNLLKLVLHFIISAHSAPHTDGLWSIVLRDLNEAISVWNMSLFSVLSSAVWYYFRPVQCWVISLSLYRLSLTTNMIDVSTFMLHLDSLCVQMLAKYCQYPVMYC